LNSGATGSKVSNIARHFERLHRDSEKASRRYAVIRGRRARPVASARATVEVFDSVKEALKDESESSDSQSDADDEDEGDAEGDENVVKKVRQVPQSITTAASVQTAIEVGDSAQAITVVEQPASEATENTMASEVSPPEISSSPEAPGPEVSPSTRLSQPISPLSNIAPTQASSETPVASDMESSQALSDRQSTIMKALSGFWPQPTLARPPVDLEGDDPMADPEHIFRESSMVVRTDEPTSIIALALKCVCRRSD
jgi:1-phosphatidylinositol-3-phosphate 5-kinase